MQIIILIFGFVKAIITLSFILGFPESPYPPNITNATANAQPLAGGVMIRLAKGSASTTHTPRNKNLVSYPFKIFSLFT